MGRELIFSHPEIAELCGSRFVPYAGDQWYLHRQEDAVGRFFWKVVDQGHRRNRPRGETRQGIYVAAPDGALLASDHFHPSPERMLRTLRGALERWEKEGGRARVAALEGAEDPRFQRRPPEGGLILKAYTRIDPARERTGAWTPNDATGRDHVWLTAEDLRALEPAEWRNGFRYPVPPAVAERIVRFHLVDNVRGEPDFWQRGDVKSSQLHLVVEDAASGRLRLEGAAHLEAQRPQPRGYEARIQGTLVRDRRSRRWTRFDVLAWGEAWGEGTYTRRAPAGRFPLLVAFSLAGDRPADRVPPQASRHLQGYLHPGQ